MKDVKKQVELAKKQASDSSNVMRDSVSTYEQKINSLETSIKDRFSNLEKNIQDSDCQDALKSLEASVFEQFEKEKKESSCAQKELGKDISNLGKIVHEIQDSKGTCEQKLGLLEASIKDRFVGLEKNIKEGDCRQSLQVLQNNVVSFLETEKIDSEQARGEIKKYVYDLGKIVCDNEIEYSNKFNKIKTRFSELEGMMQGYVFGSDGSGNEFLADNSLHAEMLFCGTAIGFSVCLITVIAIMYAAAY